MSWEFVRQLGIGEKEHVRTLLLGVGFFGADCTSEQLRGAIRAADNLGMMLRAHVNFDRLDRVQQDLMYALFRSNSTHQIEPWTGLERPAFDSMCKKLEIMVVPPSPRYDVGIETIMVGILEAWHKSGGRFLKGNFAKKTDDELRYAYPEYYHDTDRFWKLWNA